MMETLDSLVTRIKKYLSSDENVYNNEQAVREQIISPILKCLGWETLDPMRVRIEFQLQSGRDKERRKVDYALFTDSDSEAPKCIVEAKAIGKASVAEDQLFEYAYHTGVPLAIISDGQEWKVYVPFGQGGYQDRLVRTINLDSNSTEEVVKALKRYLSFRNVESGKSVEYAEEDRRHKVGLKSAKNKLKEAWINLTTGRDAIVIEFLIEETSRISGYPPEIEDVIAFLNSEESEINATSVVKKTPIEPTVLLEMPAKKSITVRRAEETYWLFGEERILESFAQVYRDIMESITPRISDEKVDSLEFLYRFKSDMNKSYQRNSYQLSNGLWITNNIVESKKLEHIKAACDAALVSFGTKSGVDISNLSIENSTTMRLEISYWLFGAQRFAKTYTLAYIEIMEELAHLVPEDKIDSITSLYRNKSDIKSRYNLKAARQLTNGLWIHTHSGTKVKRSQVRRLCKLISVEFGSKSGVIF